MATGAQAIEAIARATGLLPATVGRAARSLREAGQDLWPQAAPGGGKNAVHVRPGHLVNLVIALAVADPLTTAAVLTVIFRSLIKTQVNDGGYNENYLKCTFGQCMEKWVYALNSDKSITPSNLALFADPTHGIKLILRKDISGCNYPSATLDIPIMGTPHRETNWFVSKNGSVDDLLSSPDAPLRWSCEVPFSLLVILTDLWADTLRSEAWAETLADTA